MSNQVSIIVFEIEHPLWIRGSHNLKILLKWLTKFRNLIISKQNNKFLPLEIKSVLKRFKSNWFKKSSRKSTVNVKAESFYKI